MKSKTIITAIIAIVLLFLVSIAIYPLIQNKIMKALYPLKFTDTVLKYAEKYNVEPALIFATIKAESNFNEKAVSRSEAYGLMQITNETFWWLQSKTEEDDSKVSASELINPEVSIKYGSYLLKLNLESYHDMKTAMCAYNAGRSRTEIWLKDTRYSADGKKIENIPYPETDNYVKKVLKAYDMYKKLYFNNKG